jgi:hypothetical protein
VKQYAVRGNDRDGRLNGVRCRASSRSCVNVRAFAEGAGWRPQRVSVPSVVHPPTKVRTAGPMLLNRCGYTGWRWGCCGRPYMMHNSLQPLAVVHCDCTIWAVDSTVACR